MFMFLLLDAYPRSLLGLSDHDSDRLPGLSRSIERSRAPSDNGVKRVRKKAARAAVEAADVVEVSAFVGKQRLENVIATGAPTFSTRPTSRNTSTGLVR